MKLLHWLSAVLLNTRPGVQDSEPLQESRLRGEESSAADKAIRADSFKRRMGEVFAFNGATKAGSEKGREEQVGLYTPELDSCLRVWVR